MLMTRYLVVLTVLALAHRALGQIVFEPPAQPATSNPYYQKLTADQLARLRVLQKPGCFVQLNIEQATGVKIYRLERPLAAGQLLRVLPDGRLDYRLGGMEETPAQETYFRKSDLLRDAAEKGQPTSVPQEDRSMPTTRPVDTERIIIKPALPLAKGTDGAIVRVARWE